MSSRISIALVGDFNPSVTAHQAIPLALGLAAAHHRVHIDPVWVPTVQIWESDAELAKFDGVWCVPASPYKNTEGALDAIRFARERSVPFLGTCGGFQHALIEYARNVLRMGDAAHAELDPSAQNPVVTQLTCSLVEVEEELILEPASLLFHSYQTPRIREGYRCSYGPNPAHQAALFSRWLRVNARNGNGEVRGAELHGHPFFLGVLFQPERRALKNELPPIVREFTAAMIKATA